MREIGVRDLKASLSEVLRRVGRGEQVRVTVRGEPIADIVPARARDDRLSDLIAEGRVVPPSRALPSSPPRLSAGRRSASELILAERDHAA
jgi:prevent-host-death family protein